MSGEGRHGPSRPPTPGLRDHVWGGRAHPALTPGSHSGDGPSLARQPTVETRESRLRGVRCTGGRRSARVDKRLLGNPTWGAVEWDRDGFRFPSLPDVLRLPTYGRTPRSDSVSPSNPGDQGLCRRPGILPSATSLSRSYGVHGRDPVRKTQRGTDVVVNASPTLTGYQGGTGVSGTGGNRGRVPDLERLVSVPARTREHP